MSKLIRKSLTIVLSFSMLLLGACKGAPENNVLTVPAEIPGTVRATAYFTDGTEVPLIWSN